MILSVGTTKLDPTGTQITNPATDSWTPTANRLLVACFYCENSLFDAGDSCAGNGLTWTRSAENHAFTQNRFMVFTADSGNAPSAGATTITVNDTCNSWHFVIYEAQYGDVTDPLIRLSEIANGAGNTPSVTFANPTQTDSAIIGQMRRFNNTTNIVPPTGYTEDIEGNTPNTDRGAELCHHDDPGSTTTLTWGATNADWIAIGLEIVVGYWLVPPA